MFEVIAAAWQGLQDSLAAAGSMADVLRAHRDYLARLIDRALLSPRTAPVAAPLETLLALALRFVDLQAELVTAALAQVRGHSRTTLVPLITSHSSLTLVQVEVRRTHEINMARRSAAGELAV